MVDIRYLLKRSVYSVITVGLVSVIVFLLTQLLPGDAAVLILGQEAGPEQREAVRQELGLNRPIYVQYFDWVTGFVTGDMGRSFLYGDPVADLIMQRLPRSLYLAGAAMLVSVATAIPLGIYASQKQNETADLAISTFAFAGISIPNFFWALVFILIFASYMGLFPVSGYVAPTQDFVGFLHHIILPAAAIGWGLMAHTTRMMRSSMLEVFRETYIDTARSKGVPRRSIVYKHTLRNALLPTLTVIGFQIGYAFGGVIIIEYIFGWPGIGSLLFSAVLERDLPVIQAAAVVIATVFVTANFAVDILYGYLDPRIRYGGADV